MNLRPCGRQDFETRPVAFEFPGVPGVCTVCSGGSEVMALARLTQQAPTPLKPSSGQVRCHCAQREIESVISQVMTGCIPLESLCITPGHAVYLVNIEVQILKDGGCVTGLAVTAAATAAMHIGVQVSYIPAVAHYAVSQNGAIVVDPEPDEESESNLTAVVDKSGAIRYFECTNVGWDQLKVFEEAAVLKKNCEEAEEAVRADLRERRDREKAAFKITQ